MKYRDSGMPNEEMWSNFFNPFEILEKMEVDNTVQSLLDIGCGYGTFLLPESQIVKTKVLGIDIDSEMTSLCQKKIVAEKINNVELLTGDVSDPETFEKIKTIVPAFDYITLFNILHCEEPTKLLQSVFHLLKSDGKIGVIHWKYEKTPRGPAMEIRPKPEQIIEWANSVGFKTKNILELPPYHYGIIFSK